MKWYEVNQVACARGQLGIGAKKENKRSHLHIPYKEVLVKKLSVLVSCQLVLFEQSMDTCCPELCILD